MRKNKLSQQHIEALKRAWQRRKAKGLGEPWNKNKPLSEAHREALKKGWIKRKEKGLGELSEETKRKISEAHKGRTSPMLGRKHTEETKRKMGKARLGEKNVRWRGDDVEYRGLHNWIERTLGRPDTCEHCGKTGLKGRQIQWANIDHKYRRNPEDWIRLCPKCHRAYDNR